MMMMMMIMMMMMMMMMINKINNRGHGKIIKCKEIMLFDNEFPIGDVFKINSTTIVIE